MCCFRGDTFGGGERGDAFQEEWNEMFPDGKKSPWIDDKKQSEGTLVRLPCHVASAEEPHKSLSGGLQMQSSSGADGGES